MDLKANGFKEYARVILNGYLEASGDYELMQVLRHYIVYRSMVRAKVTCLRDAQKHTSSECDSELIKYLDIAEQSEKQSFAGQIVITHGLSGSGKSWFSKRLVEAVELILIRSDIVRKRMYDEQDPENEQNDEKLDVYSAAARGRVYERLLASTKLIVDAGYPVIVDATFLEHEQRRLFKDLAEDCGVGFKILDVQASRTVLESRIMARQQSGSDASEADTDVLNNQIAAAEPLQSDEQNFVVVIDSEMDWNREAVLSLAEELELF
jgi:predicted kinase